MVPPTSRLYWHDDHCLTAQAQRPASIRAVAANLATTAQRHRSAPYRRPPGTLDRPERPTHRQRPASPRPGPLSHRSSCAEHARLARLQRLDHRHPDRRSLLPHRLQRGRLPAVPAPGYLPDAEFRARPDLLRTLEVSPPSSTATRVSWPSKPSTNRPAEAPIYRPRPTSPASPSFAPRIKSASTSAFMCGWMLPY